MPHFRIETNVPKSKIPQDFVSKAVPVLAKSVGKPEQYCVVSVIPDVLMNFGGTTEPCAIANLMSIGALGVEQNKKHAKVLFELVEKELGVPQDRMYITFQDEPTGNVGFKGTTFHAIFGFVEEAREVKELVDTLSNLLTSDRTRSQNSSRPQQRQPQTSRQQGPGYPVYPQHTQNTTQAAQSHPTLERTRSPYNYTNQELHGAKKENTPNTLYPNLNTNRPSTPVQKVQSPVTPVNVNVNYSRPANTVGGRTDTGGFVVVGLNQASARPKPSAPPAPELTVPEPSVRTARTPVRPNNVTPAASASANAPTNGTGQISRGRAADDKYNCPTCSQRFGATIFQCKTGHGSCQACKQNNRACGKCREPLTNTRNIMLEGFVAENLLVTKTPCPNVGCILQFNDLDMQNHLKDCPFGETDCPMGKLFGQCSWRYKIDNLIPHFDVYHKEQLSADVGKEMYIFNICMETQKVFLVKIGPYHFLVHVKVSDVDLKINMAVQLFGPANSAFKWTYEIHVYNKRQPRRKFQYTDNCLSISTPIHDIFKESKCAVLPLAYAMTFVNESTLTYKFYIKKTEGKWRGRNRGNVNNQKNE